jgi:glycosyltransferase involved in cell wall biosynthesis
MLAKPSLESLKRSVAHARGAGLTVEIITLLDRCDAITRDMVARHSEPGFRVIKTDFGDPGLARNHAVASAEGTYIAFLDADDLWGVNWLTKAVAAARTWSQPVIWHPEICVYFGAARYIFRHIDMEEPRFSATGLLIENYWTALSFGAREIYADNPYPGTDLTAGFGFEDWAWNMQTISRGILHKIVPGTGHVIRRRERSVSRATVDAKAVPRPTPYLQAYLHRQRREKEASEAHPVWSTGRSHR